MRSAANVMSAGTCDLTFFKGKQSDGSIVWAKATGGTSNERIREIVVMPVSEAVFWLIGSVGSAPVYSSVADLAQMFVSKHSTSTGAILTFKVINTAQSGFLTSGHLVKSNQGTHLALLGISLDSLGFSLTTT
jgi:hypothetical protein